jgi:hypothetical protein
MCLSLPPFYCCSAREGAHCHTRQALPIRAWIGSISRSGDHFPNTPSSLSRARHGWPLAAAQATGDGEVHDAGVNEARRRLGRQARFPRRLAPGTTRDLTADGFEAPHADKPLVPLLTDDTRRLIPLQAPPWHHRRLAGDGQEAQCMTRPDTVAKRQDDQDATQGFRVHGQLSSYIFSFIFLGGRGLNVSRKGKKFFCVPHFLCNYCMSRFCIACSLGDFETSSSRKKTIKTAWMEYELYVKCSRFVSRYGSVTKYG